ncbi:MAG TPA: IS982 family transposase [Phormidium sp.]
MSEQVIAIYCFIDDFLKTVGHKTDAHCKVSDAEIMTTALIAARYFYGNQTTARIYMKEQHGVTMIDKSGFSRRLHCLEKQLVSIFYALAEVLKELNTSCQYLIDSFPVPVCDNIRIPTCRLLQGEAYRGKSASKRRYFYGFRVQVITTADGLPVEYFISAGSFVDVTAFQAMPVALPEGSQLYADSGYTDYGLEDFYQVCEAIELKVARKSNSKRQDRPCEAYLKNHYRKKIENVFSGITAFFPKKIHAVTAKGFLLKIMLFLFAYTFTQLL